MVKNILPLLIIMFIGAILSVIIVQFINPDSIYSNVRLSPSPAASATTSTSPTLTASASPSLEEEPSPRIVIDADKTLDYFTGGGAIVYKADGCKGGIKKRYSDSCDGVTLTEYYTQEDGKFFGKNNCGVVACCQYLETETVDCDKKCKEKTNPANGRKYDSGKCTKDKCVCSSIA